MFMIRTATAKKKGAFYQLSFRLITQEITLTLNNSKRKELETVLVSMLISKF